MNPARSASLARALELGELGGGGGGVRELSLIAIVTPGFFMSYSQNTGLRGGSENDEYGG
jgi:hypothetical protein